MFKYIYIYIYYIENKYIINKIYLINISKIYNINLTNIIDI